MRLMKLHTIFEKCRPSSVGLMSAFSATEGFASAIAEIKAAKPPGTAATEHPAGGSSTRVRAGMRRRHAASAQPVVKSSSEG